jgi:hypothetical protein
MQANLERGKAASGVRSVGRFAILAGTPLIGVLALCAPDRALAACGGASHPAHAAAISGGSVHAATGIPATSGGGGGGGSLGCANGSSASALHGLATTTSGRVIENGGGHTATHTRTSTTRTANTSTHSHVVRPQHRA